MQGVRTVDGATGELTSVQFVDEDFDGIDSPRWRALHNSPDHPDHPGPSGHPEHPGRFDDTGRPGRFDDTGRLGRFDDTGRPPRLDSPYGSTTAAEPEPPMAPTPDEVAARQAWPGAPTVRSASAPRRGPNRAVLIVLVLLVVAVVAALLWFFFLRGGGSSSAPPPSPRHRVVGSAGAVGTAGPCASLSAIDPGRRYVSATPDAIELARIAARAAAERKAEQIIAIDVSERLALTDVFLIVSGANDRQVRSIVDAVDEAMFKAGAKRKMREGFDEARWVLIDYGDIVVHVQQTEDREFYALERLWKDCPLIELPEDLAEAALADADE